MRTASRLQGPARNGRARGLPLSEGSGILAGHMSRRFAPLRAISLGGVAAAGVILGHWLSYRLAVPDGGMRHHVLAETGHSYWLLAVRAAILLGLVGAGLIAGRQIRTARPYRAAVERYVDAALRLAVLQVSGFAAMEVAERAVSGAPIGGMFVHHLFLLGVAVQVLVACAGGLAVVALSRAGRRIGLALRPRHPMVRARALAIPHRVAPPRPRPLLLAGAAGVRGPPALSFPS
jgi:hypothetical protein